MKKLLISLVFLFLLNNTAWAIDQSEFQSPIDQDYYESIWGVNAICGPTSAAEMIDFWGHHGYPNLGTDEEGILWDMIYEYIYRTSSGATYFAVVSAFNEAGESENSNELVFIPLAKPGAPTFRLQK
jgi:hypothetical protein